MFANNAFEKHQGYISIYGEMIIEILIYVIKNKMIIAKWTKCVNVRSAIENKRETKLTVLSIFETLLL